MRNSLETRIGIFVALVFLAAVFILDIVGGPDKFTRGRHLYALFDNVQELKVGDRVKLAGVEVGRVEGIQLVENRVKVKMKVRRDAEVKTDSTATIKFTGLVGQNYVSLDFGTPGAPLAVDGAVLTSAEQPDLGAMLAKLDSVASGVENLTKSFTGDRIDNLLGPFTDFLKANREPLSAAIANMSAVSAEIAAGKGTVGKLIFDDSFYNSAISTVSNLQSAGIQANLALMDARRVIAEVNAGQGSIGRMVKDPTLYNETAAAMTNLRGILQKINEGQGSVGKLVNEDEFYKNAKMTLQKLDKSTEGLEDQGPLSVLGIAINHLF
jgi:phospholipid/cholesterol/gamma-HCH transport system substrate-binding protein